MKYFKVLRLLWTLKPLRFISHNSNIKLVVGAIFESVPSIFNVALVIIFVWLFFGILVSPLRYILKPCLGSQDVNILKDKLNYCNVEDPYGVTDEMCAELRDEWLTQHFNFDNIGAGLLTLVVVSTLEGWPEIMYYTMDASLKGPVKDNMRMVGIFFAVFILLSSIILMNLFIGVVFYNYVREEEKEKKRISFSCLMSRSTGSSCRSYFSESPGFLLTIHTNYRLRKWHFKLVESKRFETPCCASSSISSHWHCYMTGLPRRIFSFWSGSISFSPACLFWSPPSLTFWG